MDKEKRLIVIISKVTEHPNAPTKPGIYRYREYFEAFFFFTTINKYTYVYVHNTVKLLGQYLLVLYFITKLPSSIRVFGSLKL